MTVKELRKMLRLLDSDTQVMVQVMQEGNQALMTAANRVYLDRKGSRAVVVIDLEGHVNSKGELRDQLQMYLQSMHKD